MHIDLIIPCFVDQLYPQTAINMVKVLERLGLTVHYQPEQTCCGMAAYYAGFWNHAREVGEKFILEFKHDRPAICPSAACTGMIRNDFTRLFHNSSIHNQCKTVQKNTRELAEWLQEVGGIKKLNPQLNTKIAWLDTCQSTQCGQASPAAHQLLAQIEGLEIHPLAASCCGFGGAFAVKSPDDSVAMALNKLSEAKQANCNIIASADSSCLMQLQSVAEHHQQSFEFLHLADVIAKSIAINA